MARFPERSQLPPEVARRVNEAADAAVHSGGLDSLQALHKHMAGFEGLARRALLRTLLREHFEALQKIGGPLPAIADYLAAFPDAEEQTVVREIFAEQLPSLRVELGREIGRGGMGVIYEGRQTAVGGRRVAVKMLDVGLTNQAALWNRLREEVDILAQIPSTNVVQVFDVGLINGQLAVVMELAEQSLHERTGGLPQDQREAAQTVRKLAVAIQKAHDHPRKLIHQDLKPSNVLVMPDGEYKVADFGLSHSAKTNDTPTAARIVGTPGWLAPEQARGEVPTFATDVWGLGTVLYFLLTGAAPFPTTRDRINATVTDALPSAAMQRKSAGGDSLEPKLDAVVRKCLQKDAAQRYRRPIELAEDLQRFLNAEPVLAATKPLDRRSHVARYGVAGVLAVACIIAAVPVTQWALNASGKGAGEKNLPQTQPAAASDHKRDSPNETAATKQAAISPDPASQPQEIAASKPADSRASDAPAHAATSDTDKSGPKEPAHPAATKPPAAQPVAVDIENHFFAREFPKGPVDCEFDLPVDDYALARMSDDVRAQAKADPTARMHESWKFEPKADRSEPRVTFTRKLALRLGDGATARETTLDTRYGECTRKNLTQFFKSGTNHFITESAFGALKTQERTLSLGAGTPSRKGRMNWKGATKNYYDLTGRENDGLIIWGLVPKRE